MIVAGEEAAFRRQQLLHELPFVVGAARSTRAAVLEALRLFCEAGGWIAGQAWFPDADGRSIGCAEEWHTSEPGLEPFHRACRARRFRRGERQVGYAWETGATMWTEELSGDPSRHRRAEPAAAAGLRTALLLPVVSHDEVRAVLEFLTREESSDQAGLRELIAAAAAELGRLVARKQAGTDLRHSEVRFRAFAESASDAIVSMDPRGTVTFANQQALRLFGQSRDLLLGAPVTVLIPERFSHAHPSGLRRYLGTGRSSVPGGAVTTTARRSDGTEFPIELTFSTWEVDGLRHCTAIIRDASERHRTQRKLEAALGHERAAAQELRQRDELRTSFFDALSHDVRNPLAVIRLVTSLLEEDDAPLVLSEEQRHHYVRQLRRSADKILALFDDLVALERLAPGEVELNVRPTDLAEVVRASVEQNRSALGGRSVRLELEHAVANLDRRRVACIVDNLLLNVAQHTPEGTAVRVLLAVQGPCVLLCVEDSGPGVPEASRRAVFERCDEEGRGDGSGPGPGLSLVARLAEVHGGRAWVQGAPGGGASFRVLLPLQPRAQDSNGSSGSASDTTTLMICDDHRLLTDALAAVIGTDPWLTLAAPPVDNASDAVALAAELRPDVALVDVELEGPYDGIWATREIKAVSPGTKVVVISGHHRETLAVEAVEAGAAGFVEKTTAVEDVLGLIHAAARGELVIDPSELARLLPALAAERRRDDEARRRLNHLTKREREVLALMVQGCRADAVSRRLHVSLTTARTHIQNILAKLGVHSQLEAVALAARSDLNGNRNGTWTTGAPDVLQMQ